MTILLCEPGRRHRKLRSESQSRNWARLDSRTSDRVVLRRSPDHGDSATGAYLITTYTPLDAFAILLIRSRLIAFCCRIGRPDPCSIRGDRCLRIRRREADGFAASPSRVHADPAYTQYQGSHRPASLCCWHLRRAGEVTR